MKFTTSAAALLMLASGIQAHPEKMTPEKAKREALMVGRSTGKCAAAIEARKAEVMAKRSARLPQRRLNDGKITHEEMMAKRNELQYTTLQNDTCGIDGEIVRHDLRELSTGQCVPVFESTPVNLTNNNRKGLDFYLDIGVIDIETCEPLPNAALSIWNCNATGTYSGFTGIDPDTASFYDGVSARDDGTTDDDTFLRGIQVTDSEGMIEFLTLFPGYYITRTTHIHVTVQTNITNGTGFSESAIQHIGQLFFEEDLLNQVYQLEPYSAHLETLNRTTNAEDSLYSSASGDGYSAVISVSQIGETLADELVGYITIGVNTSASGLTNTGGSVNVQGYLPTVSVASSKLAEATAVDIDDGYTS